MTQPFRKHLIHNRTAKHFKIYLILPSDTIKIASILEMTNNTEILKKALDM